MTLNLKDIDNVGVQGLFNVDDTVNIIVYDHDKSVVSLDNTLCTPLPSPNNDIFQWDYSDLTVTPTLSVGYTWVMTNQNGDLQRDGTFFSNFPNTFFQIPFDVNIWEKTVNKGDVWEPEFRIDTNTSGLKVAIELTDMDTTIYKATSNVTDRGDGIAGGIDQVLLVSEADTFQFFRLYLDGDETNSFESRFMDIKITAETQDGKIQTILKKIGFTEVSAIKIDP